MSEPTPETVEELRKVLGDHWAAGMARSGAPAEWECVCDVALEMSDEAHQAHTAREVIAAGWVSPEEAKAREAAARREALLEAAERVDKAEDELRRVKAASLYADGHMQVIIDMDRRYDRLRAHADQTQRELDEALGQVGEYDAIKAHLTASIREADRLRAALAELERDEEGGND